MLNYVLVARLDCTSANIKFSQVFLCYLQKTIKDGFVKGCMLIPCSSSFFGVFFITADFNVLASQCNCGFLNDFSQCSYGFEFCMVKYDMELQ